MTSLACAAITRHRQNLTLRRTKFAPWRPKTDGPRSLAESSSSPETVFGRNRSLPPSKIETACYEELSALKYEKAGHKGLLLNSRKAESCELFHRSDARAQAGLVASRSIL